MQYARERGIHVPQPYGSIEEADTDYLFMERIHGNPPHLPLHGFSARYF